MTDYHVVYRRRGNGWRASVRGMRRCHADGRTLRQARTRLRRCLAAFVDDPYAVDFVEDVRLPGSAHRLIVRHWAARRGLRRAQQRTHEAQERALAALRELSVGSRDASDLLGISPAHLESRTNSPKIT